MVEIISGVFLLDAALAKDEIRDKIKRVVNDEIKCFRDNDGLNKRAVSNCIRQPLENGWNRYKKTISNYLDI